MTKQRQHIFIDGKKITVISAKIKKDSPDTLTVKTDVFGQLNECRFDTVYTIQMEDQKTYRVKLLQGLLKSIRLETWVFQIVG